MFDTERRKKQGNKSKPTKRGGNNENQEEATSCSFEVEKRRKIVKNRKGARQVHEKDQVDERSSEVVEIRKRGGNRQAKRKVDQRNAEQGSSSEEEEVKKKVKNKQRKRKINTENCNEDDSDSGPGEVKKKADRRPCSDAECTAVDTFFDGSVHLRQIPRKADCVKFLEQHAAVMNNRFWQSVKFHVNGLIRETK